MNKIKAWWPSIVTVLTGAVLFIDPSVQHYAGDHPQYATAIGTLWGVFLHWAQSPKDGAK